MSLPFEATSPMEKVTDPLGLETIAGQVLNGHYQAIVYCRMPQRDRSPGLATTEDMNFDAELPGKLTLNRTDEGYTLRLTPFDNNGIRRPISQNSLPETTNKPVGGTYGALRLTFGVSGKAALLEGLSGTDADGNEIWTPLHGLYGEESFEKRVAPDADKFGQICLQKVMLNKVLKDPKRVGYDGAEPESRGHVDSGTVAIAGTGAHSG